MSIFKCEKCGCAENTALGWYWSRKTLADEVDLSDVGEEYYGKALCSECAPTKYKDGTPTGFSHKWHGKFPKKLFEEYENLLLEEYENLLRQNIRRRTLP